MESEQLKVTFQSLKRDLQAVQNEKQSVLKSLNEEFTKKDCLIDFIKRLSEKIEKPFRKLIDETLKTIDYKDNFHEKYLKMIEAIEAQRVEDLVRDQRQLLEAKIKTLKAENRRYLLAVQSSRLEHDLLGQKLIESQRETKGLITALVDEIEKGNLEEIKGIIESICRQVIVSPARFEQIKIKLTKLIE